MHAFAVLCCCVVWCCAVCCSAVPQANYSILVAIVLLYVMYHVSSIFWTVAMLAGAGFWLFNVRKSAIVISGRRFSEQEVLIAFVVVAFTSLFYVGGSFLTYSLAFAGALILIHAVLRKPSITSRATNAANDAFSKAQ